jgi:hypothetical protein
MGRRAKAELQESDIQGLKHFRRLGPLLEQLHDIGTQRDRAGNRKLFFDQYAALILLYFFNPAITSLRALQHATNFDKVRRKLGCSRASLGSLSEASRVFDAKALREILSQLTEQACLVKHGKEAAALKNLTAVDGSLLPALPKMVWALWVNDQKRAAKLHLHFDVLKGVPRRARLTHGNGSEKDALRATLEPERFYVIDRGYDQFRLFQDIIDVGSAFVARLRNEVTWREVEERPLSAKARKAGVISDRIVWLGTEASGKVLRQPLRIVEVLTGKTNKNGQPEVLRLVTNRLDLDAELVALAYRYRWSIELFFRWLKCVLGCRHLLSTDQNGVEIQVYIALIASLLISLWTGHKPTKRTFETLCWYFAGWVSDEELLEHISHLPQHPS